MPYELSFELTLDRKSAVPLRGQILQQIKDAISDGTLAPDDPLPSTRVLAGALGVSRTTVSGCYLELEGDGWVYSAQGAGTFVSRVGAVRPSVSAVDSPAEEQSSGHPAFDFRPGAVDPTIATSALWKTLWRGASPSAMPAEACGLTQLRIAIANYLASARGLKCTHEQIVICAGTAEAIALLCVALEWAGDRVAVEDPGYPAIRDILRRMSANVVPLDVTEPSQIPVKLENSGPLAAVYLTPGHQYPLGHRLGRDERTGVLNWADRTGTLVIEDDYDSEFHFGASPATSMAGMKPDSNIAYIGTFSKVLDPGLRMAYLRVPPSLVDKVNRAREDLGSTVATPVQLGVAALMQTGELSRHIARARRIYADRRRALLQSLHEIPAIRRLRGIEAGLHVVAELAPDVNPARLVDEAAQRNIGVLNLDDFRTQPKLSEPALVFGYSRHAPSVIRTAIKEFAQCPALRTAH